VGNAAATCAPSTTAIDRGAARRAALWAPGSWREGCATTRESGWPCPSRNDERSAVARSRPVRAAGDGANPAGSRERRTFGRPGVATFASP
jgi:hypothetical protein